MLLPFVLFTGTEIFDVAFVPFFGGIMVFVVVAFGSVLLTVELFVVFVEFGIGTDLLDVEVFVEFEVLVDLFVLLVVIVGGLFGFV